MNQGGSNYMANENNDNLWLLDRDSEAIGGWVICSSNGNPPDIGETYAKYKSAQSEALRRNSNEVIRLSIEEVVTDFKKDDDGNTIFWFGSDYEEEYQAGNEGWLLCDNIPFKACAKDFIVIETDDGELILKPTSKLLAIKKYHYFNLDNLPDNVEIIDGEYGQEDECRDDYIDSNSQYYEEYVKEEYIGDSNYEPLLNLLTRELYQINPFRVLGLPINASMKEIDRKKKSLGLSIELGISPDQIGAGLLPLEPAPDRDLINKSIEQLRNPHSRLIYGLFWFWPLNHSEDEGMNLLCEKKLKDALKYWSEKESLSNSGSIAKHNMAILYHLTSLDIEHKVIKGAATAKEIESCNSHWKSTYTRWLDIINSDFFGDCLSEHLQDIDDVRLTSDVVRNIRQTLPRALLSINAELAVNASCRDDYGEVKRHIDIMNSSGFNDQIIQQVLRDATKPIVERIHSLCSPIIEKSNSSPGEANKIVVALLNEIKPLLNSLYLLSPSVTSFVERCHDEVAAILRECVVIYGNETDDWKECLSLCKEILPIAANTSMINRIEEDATFIKKNIEAEEKNERLFGNLKPIDKAPSLSTINGIGCTLYGSSDHDHETQSYLTTYYFVFFAIPIFPICRYRVIPTVGGYRFLGKAPLRTFDKWHIAIFIGIIVIIALSIMFSSDSGYSSSSSYSDHKTNNRTTNKPSTSHSTRNSNYSQGTSSLISQINTGKQQLKAIESELEQMDSSMEAISTQINSSKTQINNYESSAANGQYVNQYSYNSALENHNSLVDKYNAILAKRRVKYSEYEREFKRVNNLVDRYNRR